MVNRVLAISMWIWSLGAMHVFFFCFRLLGPLFIACSGCGKIFPT